MKIWKEAFKTINTAGVSRSCVKSQETNRDVNGMHNHWIYATASRINKRSVDWEYNEKT